MKTAELRQKDVAGLQAEVKELQKAHFGLRMQKATQQLNNTGTLRTVPAPASGSRADAGIVTPSSSASSHDPRVIHPKPHPRKATSCPAECPGRPGLCQR